MFFSQYFIFPCQYHSTVAPHSSQAVPAQWCTKPRTATSLIVTAIDRTALPPWLVLLKELRKKCDKYTAGNFQSLQQHCDNWQSLQQHCDNWQSLQQHCDTWQSLQQHCDTWQSLQQHCENWQSLQQHCDTWQSLQQHCDTWQSLQQHCDTWQSLQQHCDTCCLSVYLSVCLSVCNLIVLSCALHRTVAIATDRLYLWHVSVSELPACFVTWVSRALCVFVNSFTNQLLIYSNTGCSFQWFSC